MKYSIAVSKMTNINLDTASVFLFYSAVEQIEDELRSK